MLLLLLLLLLLLQNRRWLLDQVLLVLLSLLALQLKLLEVKLTLQQLLLIGLVELGVLLYWTQTGSMLHVLRQVSLRRRGRHLCRLLLYVRLKYDTLLLGLLLQPLHLLLLIEPWRHRTY